LFQFVSQHSVTLNYTLLCSPSQGGHASLSVHQLGTAVY